MPRFKRVSLEYWWIQPKEKEEVKASGLVPSSLVKQEGIFSEARACVWAWYRSEVADKMGCNEQYHSCQCMCYNNFCHGRTQ